jgi:alkylhydroperoxidase family enzyme
LARQQGLKEERIQQMLDSYDTDEFTPKERAALLYAERLTREPGEVSDDAYDELRRHFREAEIVELGVFIGLCIGFDSLISTWGLSPTVCEI